MIYRVLYSGYQIVRIEADSKEQAINKFWNNDLNDLYGAEIAEVIADGERFTMHTDFNDPAIKAVNEVQL